MEHLHPDMFHLVNGSVECLAIIKLVIIAIYEMAFLQVYLFDCSRVCSSLDLYRSALPPSKLGWNEAFTPRHVQSRERLRYKLDHGEAFYGAVCEMKCVGV